MIRLLAYLASAVIVLWAAIDVPMPYIEIVPGSSTSIEPLITLETETTPIEGDLALLTIRNRQPGAIDTVIAWLSSDRELLDPATVIPTGVDRQEYFRLQRQTFERSFRVAVAAGLDAAGLDVSITTRPVVFSVLPGGPSAGLLETGDEIVEVQGEEVRSGQELIALLRDLADGAPVSLTILRDDERVAVLITAGAVDGLDRPGIGVAIETVASDVELPVDVTLHQTSIGGHSAGMMIALTVYDLISDEDLARGRRIAGTGTIDAEGNVGPIGGIEQKMVAAAEAGADLVLVPADQLDRARTGAPTGLRIVGVATLDEAIEAIRR